MPILLAESCVPAWAYFCLFITPAFTALRKSSGEWDEYLNPREGGGIWKYKTCPVQLHVLPLTRAVTHSWPVLCTALPSLFFAFFFNFNFHYYFYFCTQLN